MQHNQAPSLHSNRSRHSAFGRGGGKSDTGPSVLERATLSGPSTKITVESSVAAGPPDTNMNFDDDDDLEMRLEQTIQEIQNDTPPMTQDTTTPTRNTMEISHDDEQSGTRMYSPSTGTTNSTTINPELHGPGNIITQRDSHSLTPQRTNRAVTFLSSAESERVNDECNFMQENQTNLQPDSTDFYSGPNAHATQAPLPRREHFGRYTWRVHAVASDSPFASLRSAIQEVWEMLQASDPSLIIYPWYESEGDNQDLALTRPGECPIITNELLKYFTSAYPRQKGGTYYIGVRMGHDSSVINLHRSSSHFFGAEANRTRVGYWYKALQHEKPVQIGWLLGSTPFMSPERLAAEIFIRSGHKVEIGCRWQMIAVKKNVQVPEGFVSRLSTSKLNTNSKQRRCDLLQTYSLRIGRPILF